MSRSYASKGLAALLCVYSFVYSHGYNTKLKSLAFTKGDLVPKFDPNTLSYTLKIENQHADEVDCVPIIDQSTYGDYDIPIVYINGDEQASSRGAMATIRLPESLSDSTTVSVKSCNPQTMTECTEYSVATDTKKAIPSTALRALSGKDDSGNEATLDPPFSLHNDAYNLYVKPEAESTSLTVRCPNGDGVKIDGADAQSDVPFTVKRDKTRAKQIVSVECDSPPSSTSNPENRIYTVAVQATVPEEQMKPPKIQQKQNGKECEMKNGTYYCGEPAYDKDGKVSLVSTLDPQYRYVIRSPDGTQEVRLVDGRPSVPITPSNSLYVEGTGGPTVKDWPFDFEGVGGGSSGWLGMTLASLLGLNIAALIFFLGMPNACGVGTPFGAAEIATTLLFLLQYFSFSDAIRNSKSVLSNLTRNLSWVTLFFPAPWSDSKNKGVVDVTKVENAYGCLFWSLIVFLIMLLLHFIVFIKFQWIEPKNTFPHRLRIGHWESRVLHFLTFPACTASALILADSSASIGGKFGAVVALCIFLTLEIVAFFLVHRAVDLGSVVWVWNSSMREKGPDVDDETGYWMDRKCDQLNTEPANKSLCRYVFPWKWVSTVADIEPVELPSGQRNNNIMGYETAFTSQQENNYPLGKSPREVEVITTRSKRQCLPNQKLIAGLLRTQWLDVLFTYRGLTRFWNTACERYGDVTVPLTVKTCQLAGPSVNGRLNFFFDGARVPFIRLADLGFRILVGVLMGLTLVSKLNWLNAMNFGLIASLSLAWLIYTGISCPYTRVVENYLLGGTLFTVCTSALGFMGHAIAGSKPSTIVDVLMWLVMIVCIALTIYSLVITFSIFAALCCPPLEEVRLLEKLCNCQVNLAEHKDGWAAEMPAYNKYMCKDFKAAVSPNGTDLQLYPTGDEPTLEFTIEEFVGAARNGTLKTPVACVYAPKESDPLKYVHTNCYERSTIPTVVANFLKNEAVTQYSSSALGTNIARQIQSIASDSMAVVTMIPRSQGQENRSGDQYVRAPSDGY